MKVLSLPKEQAKNAEGLLDPEVTKAMLNGLPVTVLVALDRHRVVGALGGAMNDGIFELVSLYVDEKSRRKGAARAMVDALTDRLKIMDTMIRVQFNLETEENRTLEYFFTAMGFKREKVGFPAYYAVPVEKLLTNMEGVDSDSSIKNFGDVPGIMLRKASNVSIDAGYPVPEGGLLGACVDTEVSSCSISNEKVDAYVAAEHSKDDMVKIPAMWSSLSDPRKMLSMLFYTTGALKKKYPGDTTVAALAINQVSGKIIQRMFNEEESISRCYTLVV